MLLDSRSWSHEALTGLIAPATHVMKMRHGEVMVLLLCDILLSDLLWCLPLPLDPKGRLPPG